MTDSTPRPCPDCDAEEREHQVTVGGRPGGIYVETIHADSCPTLRGIV